MLGNSTSGNRVNVMAAPKMAQAHELLTVGIKGPQPGLVDEYRDYWLNVPSTTVPRVQDMHIAVEQVICQLIDEAIA